MPTSYILLAVFLSMSFPINAAVFADGAQVFMVGIQPETLIQKKAETTVQSAPVDQQPESTSIPSKKDAEVTSVSGDAETIPNVTDVLTRAFNGETLHRIHWFVLFFGFIAKLPL